MGLLNFLTGGSARVIKVENLNSNANLPVRMENGRPVVDFHYSKGMRVPLNIYYNYDTGNWERHDQLRSDEQVLPLVPYRARNYYRQRRKCLKPGAALGKVWQELRDTTQDQSYPFNM